jgi:hypothetical protein
MTSTYHRLVPVSLVMVVVCFLAHRTLAAAPQAPQPAPQAPQPISAPQTCPAGCAQVSITSPAQNSVVASPVRVSGRGAASGQILIVRVLDATGYEIGIGSARIYGRPGVVGNYRGAVTFTVPANTQPGRIQVFSQSPADGAIEHLTSVVVMLQGSGLDQVVEQVKDALEVKDYDALATSMADPWQLAFFRSESLSLSRDQTLEQLETSYLGPGQVVVDLSVDARELLDEQASLPAGVTHMVFSTGWGVDRSDDALLLFSTDDAGQARWSGMIYIFEALRPY